MHEDKIRQTILIFKFMSVLRLTISRGEQVLPITFSEAIGSLILSALLEVPEREIIARMVAIGGDGVPDHISTEENAHITIPINRIDPLMNSFKEKPHEGLEVVVVEKNSYSLHTPQKKIGVIYTSDDNT